MPPRVQLRSPHISTSQLCRAYSTSLHTPENPDPPPPKAASKLTSRRLISVHGSDATKFLHGLTTTPIPLPTDTGIFSCFLNPQGRVLTDAFIYPTNNSPDWRNSLAASHKYKATDPSYFLEVDADTSSQIFSSLKLRKLRSNIMLRMVEDGEYEAWSIWDEGVKTIDTSPAEISAPDNRAPGFGKRVVVPGGKLPVEGAETVDRRRYNLRRILWGIPEGRDEIIPESALPQQSNIDYMGGIDYKKGCYIGQELTIRTHHTGVVRKRILPVQLYTKPPPPTLLTNIFYDKDVLIPFIESRALVKRVNRRSRDPGTLLSHVGNVGLALCRLTTMTDIRLSEVPSTEDHEEGDQFAVRVGEQEQLVYLKAVVPSWHFLRQSVSRRAPVNMSGL